MVAINARAPHKSLHLKGKKVKGLQWAFTEGLLHHSLQDRVGEIVGLSKDGGVIVTWEGAGKSCRLKYPMRLLEVVD